MNQPDLQQITTQKAYQLSASFYVPEGKTVGAVLIVPAMGVTQNYYAALASWLAKQGYLTATFDYHGTGLSQIDALRHTQATITQWAKTDCSAMLDALSDKAPAKPLYWVGHSLGGQVLGFIPNHGKITKAIIVASGSGYWRENSPELKRRAWLLWYFVAPVSTLVYGYFPGKRLGMVGDLPKGVMHQWRKWCLHPEYLLGVEPPHIRAQFDSVRVPIVSLSFTDDEFMSARNIESLHGFYSGAPKIRHRLTPKDVGVRQIGHFGFFKARFKRPLWQNYLLPELN